MWIFVQSACGKRNMYALNVTFTVLNKQVLFVDHLYWLYHVLGPN